ncbi:MAG: shikimate kinase, partial [Bacteroidota bacterium]
IQVFAERSPSVLIVDLSADLQVRLVRNKDPERIKEKPSKKDTEFSEKTLLSYEAEYRMNTNETDLPGKNVLRIDNTQLSPEEVAQKILDHLKSSDF